MTRVQIGALIALVIFGTVSAGAWGAGAFANDDALDWVDLLIGQNDVEATYRTLEQANGASYIEAPLGSMAVAAAEVVAALSGKPAREMPKNLMVWLKTQHKVPTSKQLSLALEVMRRVYRGPKSELRELWADGDSREWDAAMSNLLQRLGSGKSAAPPSTKPSNNRLKQTARGRSGAESLRRTRAAG